MVLAVFTEGSLQPGGAQDTGGAARELCCSGLVPGLEICFKFQKREETCNTAVKILFKSREGKFKLTESDGDPRDQHRHLTWLTARVA